MCTTGLLSPIGLVQAGMAGLSDADVAGLSDGEVRDVLSTLLVVANQLNAVISGVVASFDVRDLAGADGCRSTRAWLGAFGRLSGVAGAALVAGGRVLGQLPVLAGAARRGDVSAEQLGKIVRLVEQVGVEAVGQVDRILADACGRFGPADVARVCERVRAWLDPDGPEPNAGKDFDRRGLSLARGGGMLRVRGQLDPEAGVALVTALDALTTPPTPEDTRTAAQRRADALGELARLYLARGDAPTVGGVRPHIGVLITARTLSHNPDPSLPPTAAVPPTAERGEAGDATKEGDATGDATGAGFASDAIPSRPERGWMEWFGDIPTALAQRLACDSDVWRIVLDPTTGLPLDVGRSHRLVPYWMRKALYARDRGCRWPGCDTPAAWTDAHHLTPWYLGGKTSIDQILMLCRYHHSRVHEGRWRIHLDPATGELAVHRPDGRPYDVPATQPWTSPTTRRGEPMSPNVAPPNASPP